MKKLSLVLAGVILFGGLSFAGPVVKQDKAKTEKKTEKKEVKKTDKKVVKKDTKKSDKKAAK